MIEKHLWHGYSFTFEPECDTHSGVPIPAGWSVRRDGSWVGLFDGDFGHCTQGASPVANPQR